MDTSSVISDHMKVLASRSAQVRQADAIARKIAAMGPIPAAIRDRIQSAVDTIPLADEDQLA